jgi:hypothetical protein
VHTVPPFINGQLQAAERTSSPAAAAGETVTPEPITSRRSQMQRQTVSKVDFFENASQ